MMTLIRKRERIEYTQTTHDFRCTHRPGGYSFDMNEDGEPVLSNPEQITGYMRAILGPEHVPVSREFDEETGDFVPEPHYINQGVITKTYYYWQCAQRQCDCGEVVHLERFTNTCQGCGADYNMSGQILAPREQWGEETGEHWSECY